MAKNFSTEMAHARYGGVVGPHHQPRMGLAPDLYRGAGDLAQATHANARQGEARFDPPIDLDPGVDYSRSSGQPNSADPKPVGLIRHAVGNLPGGLIQM
jgi:hypothetical protein